MRPETSPANIPIHNDIFILANLLKQGDESIEVYIVGGAVRDYLLHKYFGELNTVYNPKDIDITTNLSEEEIIQRLRVELAYQLDVKVNEKTSIDTFGVVFVNINDNNYEVAPFRKDIGGEDGRHPDTVERGTIYEDAMRRDFTINNLYYDFYKKEILDFNPNGQGLKDVGRKLVRCVGNPIQRFTEDRLRILRFVRFHSRYNWKNIVFDIDSEHLSAIDKFKDLQGISSERIMSEFIQGIEQSKSTYVYLASLWSLQLIPRMFNGLEFDVKSIRVIFNEKNIKVILALLLKDNTTVEKELLKLKYSGEISESVQFLLNAKRVTKDTISRVIQHRDKRLLKGNVKDSNGNLLSLSDIQSHNESLKAGITLDLLELAKLSPYVERMKLSHLSTYEPPNIDTEELIQKGFKGPEIGKEQKRILEEDYIKSFEAFFEHQL